MVAGVSRTAVSDVVVAAGRQASARDLGEKALIIIGNCVNRVPTGAGPPQTAMNE
jgi:hypothetical protein